MKYSLFKPYPSGHCSHFVSPKNPYSYLLQPLKIFAFLLIVYYLSENIWKKNKFMFSPYICTYFIFRYFSMYHSYAFSNLLDLNIDLETVVGWYMTNTTVMAIAFFIHKA